MSLVVKLEDDLGERSEWVILSGVIPARDESQFPLLRAIDPYGRTVFNHLQMDSFLQEWEQVRGRARDETQAEAWQKVKEMAEQAIRLDETLAEAHTALAQVKAFYEWDWAKAEKELKRALELNPDNQTATANKFKAVEAQSGLKRSRTDS